MSKCNYLNWMHVTHSHVYTVFFQLQRPSWWFCHHHGDSVSLHQTSRTRLFSLRKKITDHLCHWHVWVRKMCRNDRQLGKMAHRLSKLFFWVLPALFPFLFFSPFFFFFLSCSYSAHTCQSDFPKAQFRSRTTWAKVISSILTLKKWFVVKIASTWMGSCRIGRISVGWRLGGRGKERAWANRWSRSLGQSKYFYVIKA